MKKDEREKGVAGLSGVRGKGGEERAVKGVEGDKCFHRVASSYNGSFPLVGYEG